MAKTFDDKKIIYTMDRVSRAYGTKVVLKDISISYYYGAKIGVIGENGAGKSSLFKILLESIKTTLAKQSFFRAIQWDIWSRSLIWSLERLSLKS